MDGCKWKFGGGEAIGNEAEGLDVWRVAIQADSVVSHIKVLTVITAQVTSLQSRASKYCSHGNFY